MNRTMNSDTWIKYMGRQNPQEFVLLSIIFDGEPNPVGALNDYLKKVEVELGEPTDQEYDELVQWVLYPEKWRNC